MELPRVVYQTHESDDIVPTHIFDSVQKFAPEYVYEFYDEKRIVAFLSDEFSESHVERYMRLKLGAHKADLWRYCILYKRGGVYLDIKTKLTRPLREVFAVEQNVWYCDLGALCGSLPAYLHQGVIASPAGNPVLKLAIDEILITSDEALEANYHLFCQQLYRFTTAELGRSPAVGFNRSFKNGCTLDFVMFNEVIQFDLKKDNLVELRNGKGQALCGKHDVSCISFEIMDKNGVQMMITRYASWPWKQGEQTQQVPRSLLKVAFGVYLDALFYCFVRLNRSVKYGILHERFGLRNERWLYLWFFFDVSSLLLLAIIIFQP